MVVPVGMLNKKTAKSLLFKLSIAEPMPTGVIIPFRP